MNPDATTVGYCRACGKPLDQSSLHSSGGTIYCEEHAPMTESTPRAEASPYTSTPPSVAPNAGVSPGLAFILGMIPGVGAIYNGQYAKGLIHVIVIGLMISILDTGGASRGLEPLFGMLLAGFWFYMAFEAYHTARKRQAGEPVDEFSSLVPLRGAGRFPVAPLVLIGMGVVFLLNNLEIVRLSELLRFWPVGLIGLGAYMLYARMAASPSMPSQEARHEPQ